MLGHNHIGKNGRFGNQMFQYAATRGIAAARGYDFMIPDGPRTDEEFVDEEQQHKLFMAFKLPSLFEGKSERIGYLDAPYINENGFRFNWNIFNTCSDNVNLFGYFQSEKYFKHIEDEIRKDFSWRDDVFEICEKIYNQIAPEGKAISLHIRRTDHLLKPQFHPVLPITYYENALKKFDNDLPVIIFSDDPKWCNQQELFDNDRYFISEGGDNITDMCLMSMCSHHIIANSTFSWWGAWLSGNNNVIGPKLWFGPAFYLGGQDPTDIFIDRWEYLDV